MSGWYRSPDSAPADETGHPRQPRALGDGWGTCVGLPTCLCSDGTEPTSGSFSKCLPETFRVCRLTGSGRALATELAQAPPRLRLAGLPCGASLSSSASTRPARHTPSARNVDVTPLTGWPYSVDSARYRVTRAGRGREELVLDALRRRRSARPHRAVQRQRVLLRGRDRTQHRREGMLRPRWRFVPRSVGGKCPVVA